MHQKQASVRDEGGNIFTTGRALAGSVVGEGEWSLLFQIHLNLKQGEVQ